MAQTFGFGDLLQSKMMATSNGNVNTLSSAKNDDEDAYDLSLGLSLGVVEKHKDECDNESHQQKKKEFQAIRRQKVREKREEKHLQQQQHRTKPSKRKGSPMTKTRCGKKDRRSAECCDAGGEICTGITEEDKCSEMSSSNPHSNGVSDGVITKQPTFPILPIAYPYPPPMPVPMGYSFPYMMPFWSSAATDHCKSSLVTVPPVPVLQPVGSRAFPLFTPPPPSPWMTASTGHENGPVPYATASSGKSSSAVSDYDSLSSQGCSSQENDNENDSKSQTSTVEPPTRLSSLSKLTAIEHGSSEPSGASTNPTDTDAKPSDTDIKAESPICEDEKEDRKLMMPSVTTIGADGKTVKGYLYSYSKGEVSIMCVCHSTLLTPAEFVKHAGRTDYEHPERHIVVSAAPSPALRSTPVSS